MSGIPAADRLRRLLSLLPWVAAHRGPTVEEVCARFDLEPDDLLSDVALVSMVGVPPYSPGDLFDVVVEEGRVWVHLSPSFDRSLRLTPGKLWRWWRPGRACSPCLVPMPPVRWRAA